MDPKKLMGYSVPGDQKVPVPARDWRAMKLALWHSQSLAGIAMREAELILARCSHLEGCPGQDSETEACRGAIEINATEEVDGCPDRELRMSALVILTAARQMAPADARKPSTEPYFAPSREYFSDVLAAFAATQVENEMLREMLLKAGVEPPVSRNNVGGAFLSPAPSTHTPQIEETT
jgi:hypothetical protein